LIAFAMNFNFRLDLRWSLSMPLAGSSRRKQANGLWTLFPS
jgi:hypothetical protein